MFHRSTYLHFSHVSQDTEDDKPSNKTCSTVDRAEYKYRCYGCYRDCDSYTPGDERVFVAIVVELVVAGESQQSSKAGTEREKYLGCSRNPDLEYEYCDLLFPNFATVVLLLNIYKMVTIPHRNNNETSWDPIKIYQLLPLSNFYCLQVSEVS